MVEQQHPGLQARLTVLRMEVRAQRMKQSRSILDSLISDAVAEN